jgi:hypothetical protein
VIQIRSFPYDVLPTPENRAVVVLSGACAPSPGLLREGTTRNSCAACDDLLPLQQRWWGDKKAAPHTRLVNLKRSRRWRGTISQSISLRASASLSGTSSYRID